MARTLLLLVLLQISAPAVMADVARLGLEHLAAKVHQSLVNRQALLEDSPLSLHCEALLDHLFPDQSGAFEVLISRDHRPVAFSLPDGRIYLSAGLFLLIETEAELAFVLAHEAAHILSQHSMHRLQATATSDRGGTAGGFMVEFELEADRIAAERLVQTGLGLHGVADFMQRLGQIHGQSVDSFKGAELARRIIQLQPIADSEADLPGGSVAVTASVTASTRAAALRRLLELGDWQAVLDWMVGSCAFELPEGLRHRLWADALRISGLPEKITAALEHYQVALELAPNDWRTWLGLALLQDQLQNCQSARAAWQKVLSLAPATTVGVALWRSQVEQSACVD